MLDRDGEAADAAVKEIEASGGRALGLAVDVTDRSGIDAAVVDGANAARGGDDPRQQRWHRSFEKFLDIERASYDRVIAVNLTGTFECCRP